ncbi:MAG: tetratricopeptide repeat protein [Deltaproteobacteria bacterium]|nr:tetratricopeptide repeat protein [Deltaproteobacteria bacterium]
MRRAAAEPLAWGGVASQWMGRNRRLVSVSAGVVAVLILCGAAVFVYVRHQRQQGEQELRQGILALQSGNAGDAVSHLETAARRLSSGEARQLALFYLGEAYSKHEQQAAAGEAYEKLSRAAQADSYVPQLAALALGREAERRGDAAQARQLYERAASLEGPLKAEALFAAARILEAASDRSGAASYYEKFLTEHPDSPLAELARQKVEK